MERDSINQADSAQERIQSFAFVISVGICVLLCGSYAISEFEGSRQGHAIELEVKINPNEASVGSLVRLPGIGVGRAWAIVAYRESIGGKEMNNAVFQSCGDLQKVRGIGPKTVQDLGECLKFE
ncbi:MAG: ComEA family DNA-binding protein [Planctomycetota bacterium]